MRSDELMVGLRLVAPAHRAALAALIFLVTGVVPCSLAADYPTKTITMIVPFPPGGTADAQARLVAKSLSLRLGKPVVVDNRPGAGGRIGTEIAARALPDGHTILMGTISPLAIEPVLHSNTSYDSLRDFAPLNSAEAA
jgi:tripartite-type tricarboxylate transporter receptor subunit TctC